VWLWLHSISIDEEKYLSSVFWPIHPIKEKKQLVFLNRLVGLDSKTLSGSFVASCLVLW
jgi:hypothetical protein